MIGNLVQRLQLLPHICTSVFIVFSFREFSRRKAFINVFRGKIKLPAFILFLLGYISWMMTRTKQNHIISELLSNCRLGGWCKNTVLQLICCRWVVNESGTREQHYAHFRFRWDLQTNERCFSKEMFLMQLLGLINKGYKVETRLTCGNLF